MARGDYLSFIDPDDYVAPDFYELLYTAATANGRHDIAKGRCCKVDGPSGVIRKPEAKQNNIIREHLGKSDPLFCWFTHEHWTAIWQRSLLTDPEVRHGSSITSQDTTFQLKACYQTNDIVLVDNAYYYYVQHPYSATHRDPLVRIRGELEALEEKVTFLLRQGYDVHADAYVRLQIDGLLEWFQIALGKDMVQHSATQALVDRILQISSLVLDTTASTNDAQRLREDPFNRPYIIPGFRCPGEGGVRVSVVLPIHNPGSDIHMCIKALKRQLLDGLEFIFVDGCSNDGSMAEVEAWAKKDERVRIIRNKENLGPSLSRYHGTREARGDYLSFVNPEDYVSPNFYELLYAAALEGDGHDIAKGQRIEVDARGKESSRHGKRINDSIVSQRSMKQLYLKYLDDRWTAIYKRALFDCDDTRHEGEGKPQDVAFFLRACSNTDDIIIENQAAYYRTTHRKDSALLSAQLQREIDEFREGIAFFEESGFDANARNYLSSRLHLYLSHCFTSLQVNPSIADELEGFLRDLERVAESSPNARFLRNNCSYRALVEHHVLLPDIEVVPRDLKPDGVAQWIAYVFECPRASCSDLDGCARTMALYIEHCANKTGFRKACSRVIAQTQTLPPWQRGILELALYRRLASARNFRRALGKVKRKVLGK